LRVRFIIFLHGPEAKQIEKLSGVPLLRCSADQEVELRPGRNADAAAESPSLFNRPLCMFSSLARQTASHFTSGQAPGLIEETVFIDFLRCAVDAIHAGAGPAGVHQQ